MDCQFKKSLIREYSKYFDDLLSGERSLPFGLLVLSFQQFFHLLSSASMSARVFKFCIHNEDNQLYDCKRNQGAEIYFCPLFVFFLFSIFHSNVMNMEIFVKDFSGST